MAQLSGNAIRCLVAALLCWGMFSAPARAQVPPLVENLAQSTVEKVPRGTGRVLIVPSGSCIRSEEICRQLEGALRVALGRAYPGMQFVAREELVRMLKASGLLAVDAYNTVVLNLAASQIGADVFVVMELRREKEGYRIVSSVNAAKQRKRLAELESKELLPLVSADEGPVYITDADSGVLLFVSGIAGPSDPVTRALCEFCPAPRLTREMVARRQTGSVTVLATVTEQGSIADIRVIQSSSPVLADLTVQAVQGWRYKPAVAPDGRAFATRTMIETKFTIER
jgi:TonB family protein